MNYDNVVHEHKQRKEEVFWWITYSTILSVGFLIGIVFLIGPIILLFIYKSAWLLLLLLFLPLGYIMVKGIYKTAKKLIWKNNHLSSYTLKKNEIIFEGWKVNHPFDPISGSIPIPSIDCVVFSSYIVRETMQSNRSFSSGNNKITETAPILYVIYRGKSNQKYILTIPFYTKNPGIDNWLSFLEENDIPLKYTNYVLHRNDVEIMDDQGRLRFLEDDDEFISFHFRGNWLEQLTRLISQWNTEFEV